METTKIKKKFSLIKLGISIVLIIVGLYFLSHLLGGVIYIKGMILGLAALAGGGYLLLKPFNLACAKCDKVLSEITNHLADEDRDALGAALTQKDTSKVLALLQTSDIPPAVEYGDTRLVLGLEYCEGCNSVARMRSLMMTYGENQGSSKEEPLIDWQEISDPQVSSIIEKIGERNTQEMAKAYNPSAA